MQVALPNCLVGALWLDSTNERQRLCTGGWAQGRRQGISPSPSVPEAESFHPQCLRPAAIPAPTRRPWVPASRTTSRLSPSYTTSFLLLLISGLPLHPSWGISAPPSPTELMTCIKVLLCELADMVPVFWFDPKRYHHF